MNKLLYEFTKSSNSEFAYLLNGDWGSGKTYYIKEVFLPNIVAKNKYYISLFGVTSIEQIYNQLITQKYTGVKSGKFLRISTGIMTTAIRGVANYVLEKTKLDHKQIDINISDLIPIEDCVIVFDDLERISDKADFAELIGQIYTYFVSEESVKVIFIADESKLENEVFKSYKEKVIGFQSTLEIDRKSTIESIINKQKEKGIRNFLISNLEFILDMVDSFNVCNLRTVSYYFDVLRAIYLEEMDTLVSKKDLLYSVFALAVEEKENRLNNIRSIEEVPSYITKNKGDQSIKMSDKENENYFNRYIISLMRKTNNYAFDYYYYESIFNVIRFGKLDTASLVKDVNEVEEFKLKKQKSPMMQLVERMKGYFFMTNEEYVNTYSELIEELQRSSNKMTFDEIVFVSKLLFYLQRKPQLKVDAEALINKYLKHRIKEIKENEVYYYPQLILSRLDREIGEIQKYDTDLSHQLDLIRNYSARLCAEDLK